MTEVLTQRPAPRRRGRPRTIKLRNDYGTPELMAKKMRGETAEAIDLCLERRLITDMQHWCGLHLRWLYTLRYGVPTIRALDPTHLGGIEFKTADPEWYILREKEFSEAINLLTHHGYVKPVSGVCIYNEYPLFLRQGYHGNTVLAAKRAGDLRTGLELLAAHWQK